MEEAAFFKGGLYLIGPMGRHDIEDGPLSGREQSLVHRCLQRVLAEKSEEDARIDQSNWAYRRYTKALETVVDAMRWKSTRAHVVHLIRHLRHLLWMVHLRIVGTSA